VNDLKRIVLQTLSPSQSCQVQMIQNLEFVGAFTAKNFFPERTFFDDVPPPPPPQKTFRSVYHFRGQKIFPDISKFFKTYKFSRYRKIYHEIYGISHKIDTICPIFLYKKPKLPDCGANIARFAFFATILMASVKSVRFSRPTVRPGDQRENLETHG
jgi:hypothetical protein